MSHGGALKVASGPQPFIPQPCFMMGRPGRVPIAFLRQSPSIHHHTYIHPPSSSSSSPGLNAPCLVRHLTAFILEFFSCGVWARGVREVLVSGVANVVVVINQMSCYLFYFEFNTHYHSLEHGTNYFLHWLDKKRPIGSHHTSVYTPNLTILTAA